MRTRGTASESRGLTLVELLVSVVILGILVLVVAVGFSNYVFRMQGEAEVENVLLSAREQHTKTVSGLGNTPHGFHLSPTTLTLFASSTYDASDSSNILIDLQHHRASTSFSNSATSLSFTKITGVPSATGTIMLYNSRLNSTTTLTIYDTGLIE